MAKAPVDARDRTLGLYSIDDLYKKLLWDFGEFERLSQGDLSPNLPACYMAQNAAATAWHMGDWLSTEIDALGLWVSVSTLTGRSLKKRQDLQSWMRENLGLLACEQIADATKHAKLFAWVHLPGFSTENKFYNFYGEVDATGVVTTVHHYEEATTPIPKVVLTEGTHCGIYELAPLLESSISWWNDLLGTIRYSQGK